MIGLLFFPQPLNDLLVEVKALFFAFRLDLLQHFHAPFEFLVTQDSDRFLARLGRKDRATDLLRWQAETLEQLRQFQLAFRIRVFVEELSQGIILVIPIRAKFTSPNHGLLQTFDEVLLVDARVLAVLRSWRQLRHQPFFVVSASLDELLSQFVQAGTVGTSSVLRKYKLGLRFNLTWLDIEHTDRSRKQSIDRFLIKEVLQELSVIQLISLADLQWLSDDFPLLRVLRGADLFQCPSQDVSFDHVDVVFVFLSQSSDKIIRQLVLLQNPLDQIIGRFLSAGKGVGLRHLFYVHLHALVQVLAECHVINLQITALVLHHVLLVEHFLLLVRDRLDVQPFEGLVELIFRQLTSLRRVVISLVITAQVFILDSFQVTPELKDATESILHQAVDLL